MKKSILTAFLFFCSSPICYSFSVTTGTPWASESAVKILEKGGSATDAMVAAAFALNVTQPYNMGIGGGGFFLATQNGKVLFWNSRETAPKSAHSKMFLKENGEPTTFYPDRVSGPNPVGIPGMILGLHEAHLKLGKLKWNELLKPAIEVAENGFPISRNFAAMIEEQWERISKFETTKKIFSNSDGVPLKEGQILKQPELAKTLKEIAQKGALSFYKGDLSRKWLGEAGKLGVKITAEDLAHYKVSTPNALEFQFQNLSLWMPPLPSAGGFMVAGVLRFLEHYYKTHPKPDPLSAERIIITTEATRAYQSIRDQYAADPMSATLFPEKFINSKEEKKVWEEIQKKISLKLGHLKTAFAHVNTPHRTQTPSVEKDRSHTAHLNIIDDYGNAVSFTATIEMWFGSGISVPQFGFLLNNELSDFSADPTHANAPAPGKRPKSNMSPLLVFDSNHRLIGSIGCAGGPRIPSGIVQFMENYFIFGLDARTALAAMRFHPNSEKLEVEPSASAVVIERLKKSGYDVSVLRASNTLQAIVKRKSQDRFEAVTETRADGLAVNFWKNSKDRNL